jgi:hypothetical protein
LRSTQPPTAVDAAAVPDERRPTAVAEAACACALTPTAVDPVLFAIVNPAFHERQSCSKRFACMVRTIGILMSLTAAPSPAQEPMRPTPAAMQIFERDWVLMNWALKYYDDNGDIMLQPHEAEAAADQFRRIADTNGDGRVTPEEYRAARALIMAR